MKDEPEERDEQIDDEEDLEGDDEEGVEEGAEEGVEEGAEEGVEEGAEEDVGENPEEEGEESAGPAWALAKIGSGSSAVWRKYPSKNAIPPGAVVSDGPFGFSDLEDLEVDQLSEMYASIAGTSLKKFKSVDIARESLVYQINKMPEYHPTSGKPASRTPKTSGPTPASNGASAQTQKASRATGNFELVLPENAQEILAKLPPQARELVGMMADLAQEKESTTLSFKDFHDMLEKPAATERLKTVQPPARIFQYYRGKIKESGLIKEL